MLSLRSALVAFLLGALPLSVAAQGAQVGFGGLRLDHSLPVEITSDELRVNQADGQAVFTGGVLVGQGEMRLSADRLVVDYAPGEEEREVERLKATGNVTLVNGTEAAEAETAVYTLSSGVVVMTGNVLLTQGEGAISGQRLVIDLASGTGTMEGRVRTLLQPKGGGQ
ncbi:lipopolysaccharide export system protein LptA [Rhodovulum imhoffii]|uniref:Lipopolysaccharide export system protein LptA n=1 Tax=Rhodovulum imhoffii TaxID=365340 RepID=A0A2T5BP99_9RHOB|nr:lipopolysaccharide export system protein LptA [Rhodovulum imhoffii]